MLLQNFVISKMVQSYPVDLMEFNSAVQIFFLCYSCEAAEEWVWSSFNPQPLDASQFYTYLTMVEVRFPC